MKVEKKPEAPKSHRLTLLPLKDAVIFPHMVVPLLVGRPASLAAVEAALAEEHPLFLCAQKDPELETPKARDMHRVGVAANILQTLRMSDGTMKVVIEGLGRGTVRRFNLSGTVGEVMAEEAPSIFRDPNNVMGLGRTMLAQFEEYVRTGQRVAPEILQSVQAMNDDPDMMADTVCAYLQVSMEERQELLEELDLEARLEKLCTLLMRENELMRIERTVRDRVRDQMERGQREHYLHEQLKVIHQELGGREEGGGDSVELRAMIDKAQMPAEVKEKAEREYLRYERMPMMSPESSVIRSYLEWLCDMPWEARTEDAIDIALAEKVLNEDHYGLEKVKERILEFLAVRKLSASMRGPILCLVGPPGVGKTSLGESVARAMGRKFVRVSLGGVRDEAEIRGHRRTYIGALPGRIIQSMKKAGVKNPVFMLDEVDKMNVDFRGDPASALLEALDPAQNKAFSDHYLEADYDLSEVFFIATANNEYDIPHALHDRMEIVRLQGYTTHEKEAIAWLFLIPRQTKECGLTDEHLVIEQSGLDLIVQRYTREAGVRELERQIANVCRKAARKVVSGSSAGKLMVDREAAEEMLGPPPYSEVRKETESSPGVAIGMAWTQTGGDILTIETTTMKGRGKLSLTGQLGDVMKESGEAAYTYLRANALRLGVPEDFYRRLDLHVHVPEGAIPKDGPSAGVALLVSMMSALTEKAPAGALSMTGEITLRGRVLPVGGIKAKVLAAHRAGVRRIILPKENEKDLSEIPEEIRDEIAFTLVEHVDEVIEQAFGTSLAPLRG